MEKQVWQPVVYGRPGGLRDQNVCANHEPLGRRVTLFPGRERESLSYECQLRREAGYANKVLSNFPRRVYLCDGVKIVETMYNPRERL